MILKRLYNTFYLSSYMIVLVNLNNSHCLILTKSTVPRPTQREAKQLLTRCRL